MITFFFILFSVAAIASAVLMLMNRNAVYSAVFLIVTFFSLAGLYFLLEAPFLGIVQIIVYAGAIMVLFLFVIMLLNLGQETRLPIGQSQQLFIGLAFSALLLIPLITFVLSGWQLLAKPSAEAISAPGNVENLGVLLFTKYLYPFEVASVLLLVGIVGAIIMGRKKLPKD